MSDPKTQKLPGDLLLEAEAILHYLIESKAANDPSADIVINELVASAKNKISEAIERLPA